MTPEQKIAFKLAERVSDHQLANYLLRKISNTGATAKSWKVELGEIEKGVSTALVTAFKHVEYLNRGVEAKNIPYKRGSGKKSSEFINGLIKYFKSKGMGAKEAKQAAFRTANAAKGKNNDGRGMPADKNKLDFLKLNANQLKDLDDYENELTGNLIKKINTEVING